MSDNTELTISGASEPSMFFNSKQFEHVQRVAKVFADSDLVPKQYHRKIANCVLAITTAQRLGIDPIMFMQQSYMVGATPGIQAQLVIAMINKSPEFKGSLRYKMVGTPGQDDYGCYAYIKDKNDELLEGPTVTIKMAKDEGWYSKNGSKWKTLPSQMLRYRAASFFGRVYAPETLMGFQTVDELQDIQDMKDITPKETSKTADINNQLLEKFEQEPITEQPDDEQDIEPEEDIEIIEHKPSEAVENILTVEELPDTVASNNVS